MGGGAEMGARVGVEARKVLEVRSDARLEEAGKKESSSLSHNTTAFHTL